VNISHVLYASDAIFFAMVWKSMGFLMTSTGQSDARMGGRQ
jgi:hypothetical protein